MPITVLVSSPSFVASFLISDIDTPEDILKVIIVFSGLRGFEQYDAPVKFVGLDPRSSSGAFP